MRKIFTYGIAAGVLALGLIFLTAGGVPLVKIFVWTLIIIVALAAIGALVWWAVSNPQKRKSRLNGLLKTVAALALLFFAGSWLYQKWQNTEAAAANVPTKEELFARYENLRQTRCEEYLAIPGNRQDTAYVATLRSGKTLSITIPLCHTLDTWQDTTLVRKHFTHTPREWVKHFTLKKNCKKTSFRVALYGDPKL